MEYDDETYTGTVGQRLTYWNQPISIALKGGNMPQSKEIREGLLDSWGRRNRKLEDRVCPQCGKVFRPIKTASRYCSRPCMWANNGKNQRREVASWWKGPIGYIQGRVWINGKKVNYKLHRWIMEQAIGRRLERGEDVHHINGVKDDNRLENLELISHGRHSTHSNTTRTHKKGYKLNLTNEQRERRQQHCVEARAIQTARAALEKAGVR